MAKLGGNPDSATNQWFFNLADNSKSLDSADNNGGYTVFGEVMGDGMGVIDNMASLKIYSVNKALGSPPLPDKLFSETPLLKYTATDASNNVPITVNNLVMVLAVVVWDSNVDTAANLTPAKSTYKKPSGGGAFDLTALLYLVLILSLALWKSARNQKSLKNNFVTAL
jgi:peptidyl-prolyl cis-trans isomerase A (cyclophilin A)